MASRDPMICAVRLTVMLDQALCEAAEMDMKRYQAERRRLGHRPGTKRLAEAAGISQRSLGRVLAADPPMVSVWTADRLLMAAGLPPGALEALQDGPGWKDWETGLSEDCLQLPDESALTAGGTGCPGS